MESKLVKPKRRSGFTLVELSIVLVIIGLLIGGILSAQSMISAAQLNAQAQQIGQLDAMVMSFKTKYNYLPGDVPGFGGNGDGTISLGGCIGGAPEILNKAVHACETANFWNHMDPQQFASSVYGVPGARPISSGAGKNVPKAKMGKSNSFVTASGVATAGGDKANIENGNSYAILDASQAQTIAYSLYYFNDTDSTNSALKPAEMLALDKKLDDGVANAGNIISGRMLSGMTALALAPCSSGANYQVQNSSYECTPLIRIGAQAGDLQ